MPPKKRGNQAAVEVAESVEENGTELPLSATPPKKRKGNKENENQDSSPENDIVENGENVEDAKAKKPAKKGAKEGESSTAKGSQKKAKNALTSKNKVQKGEPARQLPPRGAKTGANMNEGELAQKNVIGDRLTKKKSKKPSAAEADEEENEAPKKKVPKVKKSSPAKKKLSSPKKKSPKEKKAKKTAKPKNTDAAEEEEEAD